MKPFARTLAIAAFLVIAATRSNGQTADQSTATPIKHLVVIFQENVSFDHYFATYPKAANPAGEPSFTASAGTPNVNGLSGSLLSQNPNSAAPFRLDRSQAATCDQDHEYTDEQKAFHGGLMDKFVEFTGNASSPCQANLVMGYYDGNTVTGLWNYAQNFVLNDNSFGTNFGPSSVGAINLISGQTHGVNIFNQPLQDADVVENTVIGDPQPYYDDCSTRETVGLSGKNVGDLLNANGVTWGWFQGGFAPTSTNAAGKAVCGSSHRGSDGNPKGDYIPHHQPFQFYASTSNPHHLPPSSFSMIGRTDQANHQYDLSQLTTALYAGKLPAVTFVKAAGYQDGHAGYSDPLAEQQFFVSLINQIQSFSVWNDTAVIISYDDSDGWYDHVMPPIVSKSNTSADALTGSNAPGSPTVGDCGTPGAGAYLGRCGYGPRLPLLIISLWARKNFVDHTLTDQASILRFIEDNWNLGRIGDQSVDAIAGSLMGSFDFSTPPGDRRIFLDPTTGKRTN